MERKAADCVYSAGAYAIEQRMIIITTPVLRKRTTSVWKKKKENIRSWSKNVMGGCAEIMHIITNAQENGISTIDLNGARTGANYGFCPILGKELDKKKGNVYYDLKKSGRRREGEQLSLFDGEEWTTITKGLKVFDKPVSLDICRAYIKVQQDEILEKWEMNNAFYRLIDKSLKAEVLNVRAARTEARDLMQDLQDIQNGITVYHKSDLQKSEQTRKKEQRQQAQEKKIERLERKLITFGYENLQAVDRMRADKWLKPERLEELEEIRQKRAVEEKNQPVQMSMADFMK